MAGDATDTLGAAKNVVSDGGAAHFCRCNGDGCIWLGTDNLASVGNLIADVPNMFNGLQEYVSSLPERYPDFVQPHQVSTFMITLREKVLGLGESAVKGSLASLVS